MKKVKVEDLSTQIRGVTYRKGDATDRPVAGSLPILRATNIVDGNIDLSELVFVPKEKVNTEQVLRENDILIAASSGSINIVGKAARIQSGIKASFGAFCKVLRPNNDVDPSYFSHFFQTKFYRHLVSSLAVGININNLRNEHLDDIKIPLPPLPEQKRIAVILDKADALRQKRRQAFARLDDLMQSVFLEMFGDPVTNPKGWEVMPFENLASDVKYALKRGPFGSSLKKEIFVDEGYLVYEQQHAIYGDFSAGRYFIDKDKYQEMLPFKVLPGDFIISCSGTVGKISRVPESAPPGVINQALLKITIDESIITPTFFQMQYESPSIQRELFGVIRGTGIKNFPPMKTVRSFPFIVPSMELQDQFTRLAKELEHIREQNLCSQDSLDNLFNSLQQRAFRGELGGDVGQQVALEFEEMAEESERKGANEVI